MTTKKASEIVEGDTVVNLGTVTHSKNFGINQRLVIIGPCISALFFWFPINTTLQCVEKKKHHLIDALIKNCNFTPSANVNKAL